MMEAEPEIAAVAKVARAMTLRRHHSMSDLTLESVPEVAEIIEDEVQDEAESEAIAELRKLLEERKTLAEVLERERKALKQENARSEMKARELERKLIVTEINEIKERSKRFRVEQSLMEKIDEKLGEIGILTEKIEKLEKALRNCEERARCMEWVAIGLRERVREAERVIGVAGLDGRRGSRCGGEEEELELPPWPVVVKGLGLAGAISAAVAAMIYFWFGRHKSRR
ncbi:hypothetical protein HN51_061118 [Arachis hypogaea]|uniref:Peroxisomal and mitochondrial division factor n=2 Tax=Arachis TaxID=3817 RepID=A0A445AMC7_ARAHY|nr:peroxisomal and mitochondrial division factor 1-like [Arachis hypogaea]QHO18301.1 Peroxisomal and mitochondrial division factor [Arachis hypogaea]RYR27490.1 hypothetical protein Ahy_B01g051515 [Arachis hypogaea]